MFMQRPSRRPSLLALTATMIAIETTRPSLRALHVGASITCACRNGSSWPRAADPFPGRTEGKADAIIANVTQNWGITGSGTGRVTTGQSDERAG